MVVVLALVSDWVVPSGSVELLGTSEGHLKIKEHRLFIKEYIRSLSHLSDHDQDRGDALERLSVCQWLTPYQKPGMLRDAVQRERSSCRADTHLLSVIQITAMVL